jgi:hypothetical protein
VNTRHLGQRTDGWRQPRAKTCRRAQVESLGTGGSVREGVTSQNPGGKKHKECPSLLTTGYLGFCDLKYLNDLNVLNDFLPSNL